MAVVRSGSNQSIPREESVIERRGCSHRPRRCFGGFEDEKRERSRVFEKTVRFRENRDSNRSGFDAGIRVRGDEDVQLVASRTASDDEKVSRTNLEDFIIRADCLLGKIFRPVSEERRAGHGVRPSD